MYNNVGSYKNKHCVSQLIKGPTQMIAYKQSSVLHVVLEQIYTI